MGRFLLTGLAFGCNFPLGKLAVAAGVNPALYSFERGVVGIASTAVRGRRFLVEDVDAVVQAHA